MAGASNISSYESLSHAQAYMWRLVHTVGWINIWYT